FVHRYLSSALVPYTTLFRSFIFVTAEYNYSYPAPLKNALDYLAFEWNYKAAGIVSYGGVSAGTRAANQLKGDLPTYKIVPIPEADRKSTRLNSSHVKISYAV